MSAKALRFDGSDAALKPAEKRVSLQTVERLSVYRRILEELDRDSVEYVHSQQFASLAGVTPAQLRRDLASFGSFGNISRGRPGRRPGPRSPLL